jgi:hypothetical protein
VVAIGQLKAAVVLSGLVDLKMGLEGQPAMDSMFYNWLPEFRENKNYWL